MGVSGEPTAGLVPGVPVPALPDPAPPDPATSGGTCRFGDGLAIGPDLEGAAEVALAQALTPLSGGPRTSCASSSRPAFRPEAGWSRRLRGR